MHDVSMKPTTRGTAWRRAALTRRTSDCMTVRRYPPAIQKNAQSGVLQRQIWSRWPDSNRRHDAYEAPALPTELHRHNKKGAGIRVHHCMRRFWRRSKDGRLLEALSGSQAESDTRADSNGDGFGEQERAWIGE